MAYITQLKDHLERCIKNAENKISKITPGIINMEGMSGINTRHFYNNLLNMNNARYLEIGTWMGSSVCSAMCRNNATVTCIDNWSEFNGPKDKFLINYNKFKGLNNATYIEQDCFKIDITTLPKFNIYMYDGCHKKESHRKALTHYYNCLDDIFIFIVDDWNWEDVRTGTFDAIKQLNLKKLYEKEIFTPKVGMPESWWNGIYIAILKK